MTKCATATSSQPRRLPSLRRARSPRSLIFVLRIRLSSYTLHTAASGTPFFHEPSDLFRRDAKLPDENVQSLLSDATLRNARVFYNVDDRVQRSVSGQSNDVVGSTQNVVGEAKRPVTRLADPGRHDCVFSGPLRGNALKTDFCSNPLPAKVPPDRCVHPGIEGLGDLLTQLRLGGKASKRV